MKSRNEKAQKKTGKKVLKTLQDKGEQETSPKNFEHNILTIYLSLKIKIIYTYGILISDCVFHSHFGY